MKPSQFSAKPLWVCAAIVLCAACGFGPTLPSYGVVPEFHLTDQSGRRFSNKQQLEGKVWVANFIFTTCAGPCPRMSGQMREVRSSLDSHPDVRFVSFTIDPARDTPPVLEAYGRRFKADPDRWYMVTGAQSQLHELKRNVFKLGDVDGSLMHSTRFVLVDRHSRIRGFYDSSDAEKMAQLVTDLKALARSSA